MPNSDQNVAEKKRKIYSENQIKIATFIGGPLIAGFLLSENFKTFGKKKTAIRTLFIWLLSTIVFIALLVFLPQNVISGIPNFSIAIIPIIIVSLYIKNFQSNFIKEFFEKGYSQASSLWVFALSVISLLITIIFVVIFTIFFSILNVVFNYENYLSDYCNFTYKENTISDSHIYIPEDASCYVYKNLDSKVYTLFQVDEVLTLEFEYQQEIGLTETKIQSENNTITEFNPVPYILSHQTGQLSEQQINEILTTEEGYLRLIGVVK